MKIDWDKVKNEFNDWCDAQAWPGTFYDRNSNFNKIQQLVEAQIAEQERTPEPNSIEAVNV